MLHSVCVKLEDYNIQFAPSSRFLTRDDDDDANKRPYTLVKKSRQLYFRGIYNGLIISVPIIYYTVLAESVTRPCIIFKSSPSRYAL